MLKRPSHRDSMFPQEPIHTAQADSVPLGQLTQLHASPPLLDHLLHRLLAQPINHSMGHRSLRSRPDTTVRISASLLMRSAKAIKDPS